MSEVSERREDRNSAVALAEARFRELFASDPKVFRAPGRVNLIGEHTDYNDGFVMPAAIGFHTCAAAAPSGDSRLTIHSTNFNETREFDLRALPAGRTGHWSDYSVGVAAVLQASGLTLRGAWIVISSDIPIGAGLSSSAALEVSTALALLSASGISLDRITIAKLCQRAEIEFTGARCGIMDQFISCFGKAGCALLLDCRNLDFSSLPVSEQVRIVVCDTGVRHALASSEYNLRRADCERSVELLQRHLPGIVALRDVDLEQLVRFGSELSEIERRRCRHVISENARVRQAADALQRGNHKQFGALMSESHLSLKNDYEVSCAELDAMVDIAGSIEGVFGARMTGGGFGGSTVNLVEAAAVPRFVNEIARKYRAATSVSPEIQVCSLVSGAGRLH